MLVLSPRMHQIGASPASAQRRHVRELREAGRAVIDLSSGNLEFATPDHAIAAAHAAALRGETRYTDTDGTPDLKDAVRGALQRDHGLSYARDEIVVCAGSTQALFNALLVTLARHDEVIVPAPFWAPYLDQVRLAGGVPVTVPCTQTNGFRLHPRDLDAAITARTRWVILNNPVNPSGAVYAEDDLAALADVLLCHPQVWILADGLYEHIVFDRDCAPTIATIEPRLKPRTLAVSGVAKSYAMMGWRIGYAAGPAALIREMVKIQSQTTSCASSVSQAAALAALSGPQHLLRERQETLRARRDRLCSLLNAVDGLSCIPPDGTFYLMVSCSGLIGRRTMDGTRLATDRDVAGYLLQAAGVAVLAGADFGLSPYVRASFAPPMSVIEDAAQRIAHACGTLR